MKGNFYRDGPLLCSKNPYLYLKYFSAYQPRQQMKRKCQNSWYTVFLPFSSQADCLGYMVFKNLKANVNRLLICSGQQLWKWKTGTQTWPSGRIGWRLWGKAAEVKAWVGRSLCGRWGGQRKGKWWRLKRNTLCEVYSWEEWDLQWDGMQPFLQREVPGCNGEEGSRKVMEETW